MLQKNILSKRRKPNKKQRQLSKRRKPNKKQRQLSKRRKLQKFGVIFGVFDRVPAYSNRKYGIKSSTANYYNGVYTGIKWQCVEYVRRYLQTTRGITFDNVDSAFEIPFAKFTTLDGSKDVQKTDSMKVGSLVIWPKHYKNDSPYGHVAVISSVLSNGINVVEQNYDDKTFPRFINYNDLHDVAFIYPIIKL